MTCLIQVTLPALGTVRILVQLCGMPFHIHGVQQQQSPFQCIADAHDEFHDLTSLDAADDSQQWRNDTVSGTGLV